MSDSDRRVDTGLAICLAIMVIGGLVARGLSSTMDSWWPMVIYAAGVVVLLVLVTVVAARTQQTSMIEVLRRSFRRKAS